MAPTCSGRVVKALLHGQPVAAKQCALRSAEAQEAFVAEALCLLQLSHSNVVALRGLCLDGHSGTLLLEYCDGEPGWAAGISPAAPGLALASCRHSSPARTALPGGSKQAASTLSPAPFPAAGRDLHSVLRLRAAGSQERLFSW